VPPQTVIWKAEPHTLAKIRIVEEYLKAWFPILGQTPHVTQINYIDAFCGPGEYVGGEKGSPIVALETALNHRLDLSRVRMNFWFNDENPERIAHLHNLLKRYTLPPHISVNCTVGAFDETVAARLDVVDEPTFLFLDPFGVSDTPFDVIQRFMRNPRCEVLINWMYQWINRFKDERPHYIDRLFGTTEWRKGDECSSPVEREDFLVAVYESQLKKVASFVWSFRMVDKKNQTSYYLFFGTNHLEGLKRMKHAMWKVSPSGDYSFSDRHAHQLYLFGMNPDLSPLRHALLNRFRGQTVTIEEIERFVLVETNYLSTHIRSKTLKPMEQEGLIQVLTPRKRAFTYPSGTKIRFGP